MNKTQLRSHQSPPPNKMEMATCFRQDLITNLCDGNADMIPETINPHELKLVAEAKGAKTT